MIFASKPLIANFFLKNISTSLDRPQSSDLLLKAHRRPYFLYETHEVRPDHANGKYKDN
jgi:hypothetical protein